MFEEVDYWRAGCNWIEWQIDYEAQPNDPLPVLQDFDRFSRFCLWYYVPNRRSPDWNHRQCLFDYIDGNLPMNGDAGLPDQLAQSWVDENIFEQHQISLASKLLAFRTPSIYVPMDRRAKQGLANLDHGQVNMHNYNAYLGRVNALIADHEDHYNDLINGRVIPTGNAIGFMRRVVDCALMRRGGRWA